MTQRLPGVGTWVRITGGLLADPEGNGIRWEAPEPVTKEFAGTLGVAEKFVPVNGLNVTEAEWFFPADKARAAAEAAKDLTVIRVAEGPLEGTLLNRDLLDFDIVSPLEVLANQALD